MRKAIVSGFVAGLMLLVQSSAFAYGETFTSGQDWTDRMTPREKLISILPPTILLYRYGIRLQITPEDYVDKIDHVLSFHPELGKEDVANIFASTVYYFEPEARPALEALERELRLRRDGYNPEFFPRLTLKPQVEFVE